MISTIFMACLLATSTVMAMGQRGPGVDVVVTIPVLPSIVVLEEEPYYYRNGYYYYYTNDRWYYAKGKRGPWNDLPRSHYSKEVKYKGKHWKRNNDRYEVQQDNDRRHNNRRIDRRSDYRDHDNDR